jgi:hypothetical protein
VTVLSTVYPPESVSITQLDGEVYRVTVDQGEQKASTYMDRTGLHQIINEAQRALGGRPSTSAPDQGGCPSCNVGPYASHKMGCRA